jgi:hypothetical protein
MGIGRLNGESTPNFPRAAKRGTQKKAPASAGANAEEIEH